MATRKTPASKAPAYPDLPDPETAKPGVFRLAWFLLESAEQEALQKPLDACYCARQPNNILKLALCSAVNAKRYEAYSAIKQVLSAGLLPFAHSHTTYFDQQAAA